VALVQYFDKKKGKALSLSSMGMEIGIITLSFTYTFLLKEYGYSGMMLITGALMLNSVIGGALIRQPPKPADSNAKSREMVTMKQGQDTSQTTPKANIEQEKKSCCSSFKERFIVIKNPTFRLYFLNLCVLPFALQTAVIFILHYCVEIEPSLTKTHLSLIWTLRSFSALVGKFVSGFVFDLKFFRGRRRVLHSTIGVAAGVLLMSLSLANSFYVVVVIVVGWGVLIQSFEANLSTSMNEFVPKNLMSSAIGLMMFSRGIGNLLGPYSAG
jgi:sugar phosphate permease